jgi:hypothetical protein
MTAANINSETNVASIFSQNRAEEVGLDVWDSFVIPPYFDALLAAHKTKPVVFTGGRGCGKSMLLRYLSHYSMFSVNRPHIPNTETDRLGLYWKVDTHYAQQLHSRSITGDVWQSAFEHIVAIQLGRELLRAMLNVAKSAYAEFTMADLADWIIPALNDFDSTLPNTHSALVAHLDQLERRFVSWVNNVRTKPIPEFLPGLHFFNTLLDAIKTIKSFHRTTFHIYIDEYENLREEQQRFINTAVKHSAPPVVFNIAIKHNGIQTKETLGAEYICGRDDYREFDLDTYVEDRFDLFAAEVFFFRLARAGRTEAVPPILTIPTLQSPAGLADRRTSEYRLSVLSTIREILPGKTQSEIAHLIVDDDSLSALLFERIERALTSRQSYMDATSLLKQAPPEAAVILPALLSRDRVDLEAIQTELSKLNKGLDNDFLMGPGWIPNNLFAAILQLYRPFNRSCPLYTGFDTYILLSHGNMRHFLELCHKSLNNVETRSVAPAKPSASPEMQAICAKQVSASLLKEVQSFGRLGVHLHGFVLRIGHLFSQLAERPSLSEPEITQFSFSERSGAVLEQHSDFIREAVKWSVLFEAPESKMKDAQTLRGLEWQLAPIYSPYFHISPRKKRKIELTGAEFGALITGDERTLQKLFRRFEEMQPRYRDRFLFGDEGIEE